MYGTCDDGEGGDDFGEYPGRTSVCACCGGVGEVGSVEGCDYDCELVRFSFIISLVSFYLFL